MNHSSVHAFFTSDHRACDEAWAAVEAAVDSGGGQAEAWADFNRKMHGNLQREESVLFPAFEAATGMTQGPTMVMRHEHEQMRGVMLQMQAAADRADWDGLLEHGDTLMMLIQQHNMKEEGALFPMADQALASQWQQLAERLET